MYQIIIYIYIYMSTNKIIHLFEHSIKIKKELNFYQLEKYLYI